MNRISQSLRPKNMNRIMNRITRKISNVVDTNKTDEDLYLLMMSLSVIPENFLLIADKDGFETDMEKSFDSATNPKYSANLKRRLSILLQDLERQKANFDIFKKQTEGKLMFLYFQIILYERQLVDAILHELVMIKIANKIFNETNKFFPNSSEIKTGGGSLKELIFLIIGSIMLSFSNPSSQIEISKTVSDLKAFSSEELLNKDHSELQKLKDDLLSGKKEELEKIFAVSSEILISKTKRQELLTVGQTDILIKELKSSLNIINEKYNYYRDDIISECRRSFSSVGQVSSRVSAVGSIGELLLLDVIDVNPETLQELTIYQATEEIGQAVGSVIPGMVSSLTKGVSKGVWSGMFGISEVALSPEKIEEKKESEKQKINEYIEKEANELIRQQNQAFSIIAGQMFMDIQCSYFPTATYSVKNNVDDIIVKFSYATQNTGIIIESLALLLSKINYLMKQSRDSDQNDPNISLLQLHSEKVFQLLKLANYGPFLAIPHDNLQPFDAGKLITDVELKYRAYEVEVLKLFEDFSQTKEYSEELLKAINSLGEIDRNKKRELNKQFWENVAVNWENVERIGSNVQETATNVGKGITDVGVDTVSHMVNKLVSPFYTLFMMGASGIGLLAFYYYVTRSGIQKKIETNRRPSAELSAEPSTEPSIQPSDEPSSKDLKINLSRLKEKIQAYKEGQIEGQIEGGKTRKKRTKRRYKNKKSYKRNRLFVKR